MTTSFADLDLHKKYSYADYLLWQFQERVELLRGKVIKMSPAPSSAHQSTSGALFGYLWTYLRDKPCKVYAAPFDVRLPKKGLSDDSVYTVVQPDVCVICDLDKIDRRGCLGAPDLVIEIVSPGNSQKEKQEKYELYEEAGVKEYWLVDYVDRSVLVYVLSEQDQFLGLQPKTQGHSITPTLFPDLPIPLNEVFES